MENASVVERLVKANQLLPTRGAMAPAPPRLALTIVTCMDARIVPLGALGLDIGDAHVLRNAGGRVTDDVLRSLAVTCGVYDVREVAVIHHTDCGMVRPETDIRDAIRTATGTEGPADLRMIVEAERELRDDVEAVRTCAYLPTDLRVWGVRYDVRTGRLHVEIQG